MALNSLILALESSSRIGSVAIAINQKILAQTTFSAPLRHSAEIFPAIQKLLQKLEKKPHQIGQIYISIGPGSFTGLRIAVTIAKIMHLANETKIVTVDTLDVIAANVIPLYQESTIASTEIASTDNKSLTTKHKTIATILDAKRGQFSIAAYQRYPCPETKTKKIKLRDTRGIWKKILPDALMTATQFLEKFACKKTPIWLLGDGLLYNKDKFENPVIHFFDQKYWSPVARNVLLLGWQKAQAGQFADPLTLKPFYLIKPDIKIKTH